MNRPRDDGYYESTEDSVTSTKHFIEEINSIGVSSSWLVHYPESRIKQHEKQRNSWIPELFGHARYYSEIRSQLRPAIAERIREIS